jgi:uncharacterized membrane protein
VRAADGTITAFDAPGAASTVANSINKNGKITGYYRDSDGVARGFVRSANGKFRTFRVKGAVGTYPNNINDAGLVTGWYTTPDENYHGFLRMN